MDLRDCPKAALLVAENVDIVSTLSNVYAFLIAGIRKRGFEGVGVLMHSRMLYIRLC